MITAEREHFHSGRTVINFRHPAAWSALARITVDHPIGKLEVYRIDVSVAWGIGSGLSFERIRAAAILLAAIEADEIAESLLANGYTVEVDR